MTREHFRGVVWPRPPVAGPKGPIYPYVVVGMVLTDAPLKLGERNETAVDGPVTGIASALDGCRDVQLTHTVGDAADVLLQLGGAWPESATETDPCGTES